MSVTMAMVLAVTTSGLSARSARHEYTVADVDWEDFLAILKAYLCSGDNNWYIKENSDGNENLMKIQLILSTATGIVCELDVHTTFLPIYRKIYIPLLSQYPALRKCYGSAISLMISRYICCWEENKSLGVVIRHFYKMIKEHNDNIGVNKMLSYLSRNDIFSKISVITRKLKICVSCPRAKFGKDNERQIRGSRRRVKRVYDIASWVHILKTLSRLDINNVDIRNDDLEEKWNVRSTKYLLFVGEGLIFCSATYLLNSTVA